MIKLKKDATPMDIDTAWLEYVDSEDPAVETGSKNDWLEAEMEDGNIFLVDGEYYHAMDVDEDGE